MNQLEQIADDNLKALFYAAQNVMNNVGDERMEAYENFKDIYATFWTDFRNVESRWQQLDMANFWAKTGELPNVEYMVKEDLQYGSILAVLAESWHIVENLVEGDDSGAFIFKQF